MSVKSTTDSRATDAALTPGPVGVTERVAEAGRATADALEEHEDKVRFRADAYADRVVQDTERLEQLDQMMSGMINEIVGGIFAIALGLVLLSQLFQVGIVNNDTGPFNSTFDTVESVGGASLTFAVLGMLALAGGTAVRMFRT
jgi:hypothetical protein